MSRLKANGLSLAFGLIFLASLVGQAFSGHADVNHDAWLHRGGPITLWHYVSSAQFWADVMENRQSEFLAVGSMAILSVYLRQRGSPESKPVGEAHATTGAEG